ncbi:MAG TPA: SRPBCC domain-containing protein [Caulobacteraceae bacterium]|jgi:uncharacterized protein YndB with AHSA1/START domain|nr:SRPBCC domain-containing protein [Caulobacteraceae bacterium]
MAEPGLGRFIDRFTVEYVRTFPHPIERVWRAISDPGEFSAWFIPGTLELKERGAYFFDSEGWTGVVMALEPPTFIRFSTGKGANGDYGERGFFQYHLEPVPGGTRMRFLQHFPPEHDYPVRGDGSPGDGTPWPGSVSGWHEFWDALADHLNGKPRGSRRARHARWQELNRIYDDHMRATLPAKAT